MPPQPEKILIHLDGPICDADPYPRYEPGSYKVICLEAKIYRDPRFNRFVCRLRCALQHDPERQVCWFSNLGSGSKPKAGRGSTYRRAWIVANGDTPRKRQVLSVKVFVGKVFLVEIGDVAKRADGTDHLDVERYSVVQQIVSRCGP